MSDEIKVTDKRGHTKDFQAENTEENHDPISSSSFSNLILSLGTSAMIHMGVMDNPVTKQKEKDLDMAKQEIDMIMMLKVISKGNLSQAEKKLLDQVLSELHMKFVASSK